MSDVADRESRPLRAPDGWWYSCKACGDCGRQRYRVSMCMKGLKVCGETKCTALWGWDWLMVAALSVACESDCELDPTEIMQVLRPELHIGPGMVIDEEIW